MSLSRRILSSLPFTSTSRAAVLAVEDHVADLHGDGGAVAVVRELAGADRHDLALLRLLLRGVRQQDPAGGLLFGLGRLDHDAVVERPKAQRCVFLGHGYVPDSLCEVES